jgi:hypothetical protein
MFRVRLLHMLSELACLYAEHYRQAGVGLLQVGRRRPRDGSRLQNWMALEHRTFLAVT